MLLKQAQHSGCVAAASTEPGLLGCGFADLDEYVETSGQVGFPVKRTAGPNGQVLLLGNVRQVAFPLDLAFRPVNFSNFQFYLITQGDWAKNALQQVITVGPATGYMKKQVDFCR